MPRLTRPRGAQRGASIGLWAGTCRALRGTAGDELGLPRPGAIYPCTLLGMFAPLPGKPDPNALELAILDFWSREDIFAQLRAKNADGPRFSFFDGPVTANKTLGVHTAWGRTLKDVFQR